MNTESKILLSRFLTRSGDQAWAFAVPIALIEILSSHSRAVFAYFFLTFLGGFILMPHVGKLIDRISRQASVRWSIIGQMLGVALACGMVHLIARSTQASGQVIDGPIFGMFLGLLVSSLIGNLASSMTDISIANDLAPALISVNRLAVFNSRLRQLDLFTEVGGPIAAGVMLSVFGANALLMGFSLIALWNLLSFIPEYLLLRSVLAENPILLQKKGEMTFPKKPLREQLLGGWPEFRRQPIFLAMVCYSILWLSVLSPHGVLLTAFLKSGWQLPESIIGLFRGLGAIFGLMATLLFPWVVARYRLIDGARKFIQFQAVMVTLSALLFFIPHDWAKLGFLLFILLSRIGLYGFSLAEGQMRQLYIPETKRGAVNGTATALNNLATLILLGLGTIVPPGENFFLLILLSLVAVLTACFGYSLWRPQLSDKIDPA